MSETEKQWPPIVKNTRTTLNLSRQKFARLVGGLDESTVWSWELGKASPHPSARVLLMMLQDVEGLRLVRRAGLQAQAVDANI
tara:strand:+ start:1483 stop:1731 length:249 start_codon:yes stop_codon:yes gene_type:complete